MNLFFSRKLIRIFFIAYSLFIATSLTSVFASPEEVTAYQASNSSINPTFQITATPESLTSIKLQWATKQDIKSYTILRRYSLIGKSTGTDIDQISGMDIIKVITEPSYYYFTDQAVDATQNNVYYQVKAEYNSTTSKTDYSPIVFLENRLVTNNTTSTTSSSTPVCYSSDSSCNKAALEETGINWDTVKSYVYDFINSSGSSTKYQSGQTIPNVDAMAKMLETGFAGADFFQSYGGNAIEAAKALFASCSADGACTTDDVISKTPIVRDVFTDSEDLARVDAYLHSEKGKTAVANSENPAVIGASTGGIVGATGGSGEGSGSGQASDDAASSAKYVLDNFKGISAIDINVFQCQSNTGIFCIIETVIKLALTLAGLIAVAFIVYGGYLYITSAGNPEGAKAGTTAVTNAAIGLIIILAAWLIVATVLNIIGTGKV